MAEAGLGFEASLRRGDFQLSAAFAVEPGDTLALLGESGAGKSTCLSIIGGLVAAEQGRVTVGDVWCDTARGIDWPPERRHVGFVFQEFALFPHLTVLGNVAYGLRARGRSRAEAEGRAQSWLDRLGLGQTGGRAARELSGGERQRVALARALATEPRVLLLDEPFGALDARTRQNVRGELRAFLHELGIPTVLVTHDPVDALVLGDRIAVLEEGRVVQTGRRDELLEHPRTPVVAALAGLNVYPVELTPGSGLREARAGDVVFHVLADGGQGPCFLSFAPQDVALAASRQPGSPQNVFQGHVREVLPMPDRLRVVLDAGVLIIAELTREAAATLAVAPGRMLWASVKATAIRVYR